MPRPRSVMVLEKHDRCWSMRLGLCCRSCNSVLGDNAARCDIRQVIEAFATCPKLEVAALRPLAPLDLLLGERGCSRCSAESRVDIISSPGFLLCWLLVWQTKASLHLTRLLSLLPTSTSNAACCSPCLSCPFAANQLCRCSAAPNRPLWRNDSPHGTPASAARMCGLASCVGTRSCSRSGTEGSTPVWLQWPTEMRESNFFSSSLQTKKNIVTLCAQACAQATTLCSQVFGKGNPRSRAGRPRV